MLFTVVVDGVTFTSGFETEPLGVYVVVPDPPDTTTVAAVPVKEG